MENDWLGSPQHCITAYNQLIVGDTNVSGQHLKVCYGSIIGHQACMAFIPFQN